MAYKPRIIGTLAIIKGPEPSRIAALQRARSAPKIHRSAATKAIRRLWRQTGNSMGMGATILLYFPLGAATKERPQGNFESAVANARRGP